MKQKPNPLQHEEICSCKLASKKYKKKENCDNFLALPSSIFEWGKRNREMLTKRNRVDNGSHDDDCGRSSFDSSSSRKGKYDVDEGGK